MPTRLADNISGGCRKVLWILVLALLLSYFFSMALGPFLVFFQPEGVQAVSDRVVALPLSVFMVVNFGIPLSISVGAFFVVMWLLYVLAFELAWLDKPAFPRSPEDLAIGCIDGWQSNYLAWMPQLSPVILVGVILLQSLQESAGVPTGGLPPEPPVIQFLLVSYAPLVEEFSYRITTIGFIDGVFLLFRVPRTSATAKRPSLVRVLFLTMWKPEGAKKLLGYPTIQTHGVTRGILRFEWALLSLTSVAFGAVHYLAGGGWDVGKISTAALSGFAMGFVYLRYGAYAPVLLHWFFNYYFGAFGLAAELELTGFAYLSAGVELLNVFAGIIFVLVIAGLALVRMWRLRRKRRKIEEALPPDLRMVLKESLREELPQQVSECVSPPSQYGPLSHSADTAILGTRGLSGDVANGQ